MYTGVHNHGGPSVVDAGWTVGDLRPEQHKGSNFTHNGGHSLDSDKVGDGGLGPSTGASDLKNSLRPSTGSSFVCSSGHPLDHKDATHVDSMIGSPARPSTVASLNSSHQRSPSPHVGPERFFYDKSSYTGVHNHGGPTVIDAAATVGDLRLEQHKGSNFTRNGGHALDSDKVRDGGLGPSTGAPDLKNSLRPSTGSSFVNSSGHPLDHRDATHVDSMIGSPARVSTAASTPSHVEPLVDATSRQRKRRASVGAVRELKSSTNDKDGGSWPDAMRPESR